MGSEKCLNTAGVLEPSCHPSVWGFEEHFESRGSLNLQAMSRCGGFGEMLESRVRFWALRSFFSSVERFISKLDRRLLLRLTSVQAGLFGVGMLDL